MKIRDRSRRYQLQRLLGDLGTVRPYTSRPNGTVPSPGWYIELSLAAATAAATSGQPPPTQLWMTSDGLLFAGLDMTHAAAMIERLRAITEA